MIKGIDKGKVNGFRLEFHDEIDGKKYALQADMEQNAVKVKVKNSTNNNLAIVSGKNDLIRASVPLSEGNV